MILTGQTCTFLIKVYTINSAFWRYFLINSQKKKGAKADTENFVNNFLLFIRKFYVLP